MEDLFFSFDQQLFLFINHLPHNAFLNAINLLLSGVGTAGLVWFVLGVILILKEEKKDHWFFLPLLLAGLASWVVVELIIKPFVARPRPDLSEGFSFPSGHATIAWAMAVVLSRKEPKWRWLFYTLAFLISFSRIYLGKHFPLDVVAGALLGATVGFFVGYVFDKIKRSR